MTHVRSAARVVVAAFDPDSMSEWGALADEIRDGGPRPRGSILWRSLDETRAAGFWECPPGTLTRTYRWTETLTVLSGSALVGARSSEHVLRPGMLLVLPVGTTATWRVRESLRAAVHLAADVPLGV